MSSWKYTRCPHQLRQYVTSVNSRPQRGWKGWVPGTFGSHRSVRVHLTALCNGKQEAFWGTLEGRLMKMLDGVADLTLELLNEATQAWVEIEYNRAVHRETSCSPVDRFAKAPDVFRTSPSSEALRDAFRLQTRRTQRQSDGTISLEGVRFEIPARYRHFRDLTVRYARWDLAELIWSTNRPGRFWLPSIPSTRLPTPTAVAG